MVTNYQGLISNLISQTAKQILGYFHPHFGVRTPNILFMLTTVEPCFLLLCYNEIEKKMNFGNCH